jgi:hypothetical protein
MLSMRRAAISRTPACALRDAVKRHRALAASLLAVAGSSLAVPVTASGTALPPVHITYSGSFAMHVFPTEGKPADQLRSLEWTATADSGGSDGGLALDFASVAGSASIEGNGDCYDSKTALSLATAKNPVAEGWNLSEDSHYPEPGWKYIAEGVPNLVPVLESYVGKCGSYQSETLLQPNEMLLKQETFTPAELAEYEAIMQPLEFTPGSPATRTRTFSFAGTSHCTCLPAPTHVIETMTLTVSATSPAPGNVRKTEPAPGKGGGSPKSEPPARKKSKALLKAVKEQAQEDLGPALEAAWKAEGLLLAPGLASGLAFSNVLDELGQQGAKLENDSATARVINDYRIINDPPDHRFHQLAKPRPSKRPALPSCTVAPSAESSTCARLRTSELAMLSSSAKATAITGALLVTVNRDSTAIRAHDYSAAHRQYVHFRSLHGELRGALKSKVVSGERVAAILTSVGASVVLGSAQSAAAISAVEAKLSHARVPTAKLNMLAKSALEAREVSALDGLLNQDG